MAEELYINSSQIEIPERAVSRTLQINNIGELKDRQANYSNSINIPMTPKNIAVLEMLGIVGSTTRLPYTQVSVKYILDGIELISDGKGLIKNTKGVYSLVIYDGNIAISDLLGKKELGQLDFSAYNHNLTTSIWTGSFTKTDGYIYGIGKFFPEDIDGIITIDTQGVSFYCHTLFQLIFTQLGYTVSGSIFSDPDFKSRVMTMDTGYDRTSTDNTTPEYNVSHLPDATYSFSFVLPTIKETLLDSFTAVTSASHRITIAGSVNIIFGFEYAFKVKVNSVQLISDDIPAGSFTKTYDIEVNSGDVIDIYVSALSEDDGGTEKVSFDANFSTKIVSNDISIAIAFGDLIGDTLQIDFIKDIMQRFGLIFRKTKNENNFEFKKMSTLLNDLASAEDWSDKFSSKTMESYKSKYAQTNKMTYLYDRDENVLNPTFGDGEFLIDDVNLKVEKTLFKSIFKASKTTNDIVDLFNWKLDNEIIVPVEDGIRIFKIVITSGSVDYRFAYDSEGSVTFTGDIATLDFDSINYQNEIDTNYTEVTDMLNDHKIIASNFNLNTIDIYNIDFFKLKYIKQLGQYFYLNKVSNYRNGKVTKVELIRANNEAATPIDPPTMVANLFSTSFVTATLTKIGGVNMFASLVSTSFVTATLSKTTKAPDLQAVTDVDNETTNDIRSSSGGGLSRLSSNGDGLFLSSTNNHIQIISASSILRSRNNTAFNVDLTYPAATSNRVITLPDATGTVALLSDVTPAQDLQDVTDEGATTTNNITINNAGQGTINLGSASGVASNGNSIFLSNGASNLFTVNASGVNINTISAGSTTNRVIINTTNVTAQRAVELADGAGTLTVIGTSAPASSTAAGKIGELRITSSYLYICRATNQWERIAVDGTAW